MRNFVLFAESWINGRVRLFLRGAGLAGLCLGLAGCALFSNASDASMSFPAEDLSITTVGKLRLAPPKDDFSGIAWIGGRRYLVVSDKKDGYYEAELALDRTGRPISFVRGKFWGWPDVWRDCEGIAHVPSTGTVFIAAENDQRIMEYANGIKTGRELEIPVVFRMAETNYGFESLSYDARSGKFWTMTESTLPPDGPRASGVSRGRNRLRLQGFGGDLKPVTQKAYLMDVPKASDMPTLAYAFGVSEIEVLPDGRILVLEREFYATKMGLGSWAHHKIFVIDPTNGPEVGEESTISNLPEENFLPKALLWESHAEFNGGNLANYEGMCLGPELPGGGRALVLINDAQAQSILDEYIFVLRLDLGEKPVESAKKSNFSKN